MGRMIEFNEEDWKIDVRYERCKIYFILCLLTGEIYIGSTFRELKERLQEHESDYRQWKRGTRHYCSSYQILERGKYKIDLLEAYPCLNRRVAETRERELRVSTECINQIKGHVKTQEQREQVRRHDEKNGRNISRPCPCGGRYDEKHRVPHFRSKRHIRADAAALKLQSFFRIIKYAKSTQRVV